MQKEITLNDIFIEIQNIKNTMVTKEEMNEVKEILKEHSEILEEHSEMLQQHTKDIKKIKKDIIEIKFVINGLAEDIGMLDMRTRSLVVYKK